MPRNTGKTRLHARAIAALLQNPTIAKAARATGCSVRTLQRWLNEPEFQALYRQAKSDLLASATARLRAASGQAVTVLKNVATDKKATSASRVTAARTILELTMRAHEIEELESRLSKLEHQKDES